MGVLLAVAVGAVVVWLGWLVLSQRREVNRRHEIDEAAQVALLSVAGGSPDRPVVVGSIAAIEPRVRREACPVCQGSLRIDAHEVVEVDGQRLRRVDTTCAYCGVQAPRFFQLEAPPQPN